MKSYAIYKITGVIGGSTPTTFICLQPPSWTYLSYRVRR